MPTILIVEDNDLNLDMLSRRLERKGFTIEECERWLAPVLNYIPASDPTPDLAPEGDVSKLPLAQHPPGCNCAMHMRPNKPRVEVTSN